MSHQFRYGPFQPLRRSGTILFAVLVVVVLLACLAAQVVYATLQQYRDLRQRQQLAQSSLLADSAIERAVAMHQQDRRYAGETWAIPASELGGRGDARVTMTVADDRDTSQTMVTAVASYGRPPVTCRRTRIIPYIVDPAADMEVEEQK